MSSDSLSDRDRGARDLVASVGIISFCLIDEHNTFDEDECDDDGDDDNNGGSDGDGEDNLNEFFFTFFVSLLYEMVQRIPEKCRKAITCRWRKSKQLWKVMMLQSCCAVLLQPAVSNVSKFETYQN